MSVLNRAELEASPLADLHTIASELSIDGYRRLRRSDVIDAILARRRGGTEVGAPAPDEPETEAEESLDAEAAPARRRRGRRGGRGRVGRDDAPEPENGNGALGPAQPEDERRTPGPPPVEAQALETDALEGVVELLANGSGFMRVHPPEPSDDDVYISAAQVKRCELVAGDRISGPLRPPRRSERFPSLVRIDVINGRPAAEVAEGARFDDLPAAFPDQRLQLGTEDPVVEAIDRLTPFGKGSRVTIVGATRAGKTEALRRLATALAKQEDLQLTVALAGVRPEEIPEWSAGPVEPSGAVSFTASADAQDHAVERVLDHARRVAARGADVVVLIDTLDGLHPAAARKALGAARNLVEAGSLTVIATASRPLGGETTVIALDAGLVAIGHFPALDLLQSGTIRPELLVGESGAEAIARARREPSALEA